MNQHNGTNGTNGTNGETVKTYTATVAGRVVTVRQWVEDDGEYPETVVELRCPLTDAVVGWASEAADSMTILGWLESEVLAYGWEDGWTVEVLAPVAPTVDPIPTPVRTPGVTGWSYLLLVNGRVWPMSDRTGIATQATGFKISVVSHGGIWGGYMVAELAIRALFGHGFYNTLLTYRTYGGGMS